MVSRYWEKNDKEDTEEPEEQPSIHVERLDSNNPDEKKKLRHESVTNSLNEEELSQKGSMKSEANSKGSKGKLQLVGSPQKKQFSGVFVGSHTQ